MSYSQSIDAGSVADGVLFGVTHPWAWIGFTLVFGVMHKINLADAASIGAAYASLIGAVGRQDRNFNFLLAGRGIIGAIYNRCSADPQAIRPPC